MCHLYYQRSLLVYYIVMLLPSFAISNSCQSYFDLSNYGTEFSPFDSQLLVLSTSTQSMLTCAQKCLSLASCRTFNFDVQTKLCQLYEGDIYSTGLLVVSLSAQSIVGSMKLFGSDFLDYRKLCSFCINNRYLTCINFTCECLEHTYFDGSICRSQKLNGSGCSNDIECRNDMNLTCLTISMQCGYAIGTSASTIISSTTSSTTSTTTTSSRINAFCINETWISSANRLAQWLFDGAYHDQMNNYNMTPSPSPSFTNNKTGYVNRAIIFSGSSMAFAPHIPLASSSFTIDMWLFITNLVMSKIMHAVFGICSEYSAFKCLHLILHRTNSSYVLSMNFFNSDCPGVTALPLNTWIHTAFVFDSVTLTQMVYLNGMLDQSCQATSPLFLTTATNTTIGNIPLIAGISGYAGYQGYVDQMTISNRVKSACEIFEIATLVVHFTFDDGLFVNDSGPNSLPAITQSTTSVASGRYGQAITFNGSNPSYFQTSGLTALGTSNKSFSISLWIRPATLRGVVVHVSKNPVDYGWCMPFLGFANNGSLVTQIYDGSNFVSLADPTLSIATSIWSHVVQTWSITNGLRLYINNVLVSSLLSAVNFGSSGSPMYVTLGNGRTDVLFCTMGQINPLPYKGDLDDFRVYSRELSGNDVHALYSN